jgi:polyketide cyclase/dehydrase/lipid transport protein
MLSGRLPCPAPAYARDRHESEWTASALFGADPHEVLDALTVPGVIQRWAPVDFEVQRIDGDRLRAGGRARVSGRVAGVGAVFDVEVLRADRRGLELLADGPLSLEVRYAFSPEGAGVRVQAAITVHRRGGLTGQLLQAATMALLCGGALSRTLDRLGSELARDRALALAA